MELHADFSRRALVRYGEGDWVPSPMPGVERRMLDRIGGEVARATTIVRFAPGSAFSAHTHDGGEEYLVLDGVFQDEDGDFPAGAYVRNPPTTRHTPRTDAGATILVKLHQFDPADRTAVHIDTATAVWSEAEPAGVSVLPLHRDAREAVRLERWAPGTRVQAAAEGGLEAFVLGGTLTEAGVALGRWDWLRLPVGDRLDAVAGPEGAEVWIKTGHLAAEAAAGRRFVPA